MYRQHELGLAKLRDGLARPLAGRRARAPVRRRPLEVRFPLTCLHRLRVRDIGSARRFVPELLRVGGGPVHRVLRHEVTHGSDAVPCDAGVRSCPIPGAERERPRVLGHQIRVP